MNGLFWYCPDKTHPCGFSQRAIDDAIKNQLTEFYNPGVEFLVTDLSEYAIRMENVGDHFLAFVHGVKVIGHTHGYYGLDRPSNLDGVAAADFPKLTHVVILPRTGQIIVYDGANNTGGPAAHLITQPPPNIVRKYTITPYYSWKIGR